MVELGIILPSQHYASLHRQTPEYRLMIAVLLDALDCFHKYRSATDQSGQQLFHETRDWLMAGDNDWLYSFEHICGVLDLNSSAVRQRLMLTDGGRGAVAATADSQEFSRRNS